MIKFYFTCMKSAITSVEIFGLAPSSCVIHPEVTTKAAISSRTLRLRGRIFHGALAEARSSRRGLLPLTALPLRWRVLPISVRAYHGGE